MIADLSDVQENMDAIIYLAAENILPKFVRFMDNTEYEVFTIVELARALQVQDASDAES